jgi:hypothetical protein
MKSQFSIFVLVCGTAIATNTALGQPRVPRGALPPWPPATGTSHFTITPNPKSQATSLEELYNLSDLVVDGTVQTVLPVRLMVSRRLETDILVVANRVFKGSPAAKRFALTQRGGVFGGYQEITDAYAPMKPGEHYLLFAITDPRPEIPPVVGAEDVPRYLIEGEWVGMFNVDAAGAIHLSPGAPRALHTQFDGTSQVQVLNALAALGGAH